MKKPKDVNELATRLSSAAISPLVTAPEIPEVQRPRRKGPNRGSKSMFLRVPPELFKKLDDEAISRTKATGRGVTVQQVILDTLTASL